MTINYFVFENKTISNHHEKNYFSKIIYCDTSKLKLIFTEKRGWLRGVYSYMVILWTHDCFKFVKRHTAHLAILECYRLSSIPNLASPVYTASPFRSCIRGTVGLPSVDQFKGYADRNPAFASFCTTSEIFSKIWINTFSWSCNLFWKINGFFLYRSLLHVTPNRYDAILNPLFKHFFGFFL